MSDEAAARREYEEAVVIDGLNVSAWNPGLAAAQPIQVQRFLSGHKKTSPDRGVGAGGDNGEAANR